MNISCIFSDDFRREADGKYSIMGVLGREMLIATPSITLPKLSITIIVKSNPDTEGDLLHMSIEVKIDGKQQLKQEVPAEALKKVADGFKKQGFNTVQHTANILMTLLPVKTGNVIEAIVSINGTEMARDALSIKLFHAG